MNSTLVVLALSSLAALAAALGALPHLGRSRLPTVWIGWANAVAGGMMLGAAYLLSSVLAAEVAIEFALGAVLGAAFILWTHRAAGTQNLDLNLLQDTEPAYGYQILLVNGLHSASEGVAIGAAMIVDLQFGIFVALAIAIHNIPEGTVLSAILRGRGLRLSEATGLAVAANVGQILLAVTVYAVVEAAPAALPWAVGFSVGALVQLVLMELLPESYREAGQTSIAVVTVVALGVVVLLKGFAP